MYSVSCYNLVMNMKPKIKSKHPTAQEIQDRIFWKMSVAKKIKLASELTAFCVKLNRLNGNYRHRKTSFAGYTNS